MTLRRRTIDALLREPGAVERFKAAKQTRDVAFLTDALRSPDLQVLAAQMLGELGAEEAVAPLIALLESEDPGVRASVAHALGRIGSSDVAPHLLDRLEVENELVPRGWLIAALGELGDRRALPVLCEALTHDDMRVRETAARALADLGDPAAIEPLEEAAKAELWFNRRPYRKAIKRLRSATSSPA